MKIHPAVLAAAAAIHREHYTIAFGSATTAARHVEKHPFDPESPTGEDFLREAVAAIAAWEVAQIREAETS